MKSTECFAIFCDSTYTRTREIRHSVSWCICWHANMTEDTGFAMYDSKHEGGSCVVRHETNMRDPQGLCVFCLGTWESLRSCASWHSRMCVRFLRFSSGMKILISKKRRESLFLCRLSIDTDLYIDPGLYIASDQICMFRFGSWYWFGSLRLFGSLRWFWSVRWVSGLLQDFVARTNEVANSSTIVAEVNSSRSLPQPVSVVQVCSVVLKSIVSKGVWFSPHLGSTYALHSNVSGRHMSVLSYGPTHAVAIVVAELSYSRPLREHHSVNPSHAVVIVAADRSW